MNVKNDGRLRGRPNQLGSLLVRLGKAAFTTHIDLPIPAGGFIASLSKSAGPIIDPLIQGPSIAVQPLGPRRGLRRQVGGEYLYSALRAGHVWAKF